MPVEDKCKIYLNINGTRFETFESTLERFPNTLLGDKDKRKDYYIKEKNEYYFARDKHIFDFVLFFYQSNGILSKPKGIEENTFKKEIHFFQLINPSQNKSKEHKNYNRTKQCLSRLISGNPSVKSIPGIIACMCFLLILTSSLTYCFKTQKDSKYQNIYVKIEIVSVAWYTVELTTRCFCSYAKLKYLKTCFGIIDSLSVFPCFMEQIYKLIWGNNVTTVLLLLQFFQIFRIIKIARYVRSLQTLATALYDCHGQLLALLFFFMVNCFLSACLLFNAEEKLNPNVDSVLDTFWFAVITMTTVGYEDVGPKTNAGKCIGVFVILSGIITLIHLFLPVYLSYFCLHYENNALMKEIKCENLGENVVIVNSDVGSEVFVPVVSSGNKNIKKEYSEKFLEELYYVKK